jgi:hypothetical protein
MNDKKTPDGEPLKPNSEEENLLRSLRNNPIMGAQIQAIVKRFEQEVADGMDAHQAEESLIQSLQELGVSMMGQWAQNTQKSSLEQALQDDPKLHKHSKKNSSGIPPLES